MPLSLTYWGVVSNALSCVDPTSDRTLVYDAFDGGKQPAAPPSFAVVVSTENCVTNVATDSPAACALANALTFDRGTSAMLTHKVS